MGYNLTKKSVLRNLGQLEQLLETKGDLRFPTETPKRLAQKLREAIKASAVVEEFSHLSILDAMYSFRIVEGASSHVLAVYMMSEEEGEVVGPEVETPEGEKTQDKENMKASHPLRVKTLPNVGTLVEVIQSAMTFEGAEELFFPKARLSNEEKNRLGKWTGENGNEWKLLDHEDGGVTLTKSNVPDELIWEVIE